ncbi:MAG: phosphatase PAP2 family protein, partial [Waddliaceae bacterium]
ACHLSLLPSLYKPSEVVRKSWILLAAFFVLFAVLPAHAEESLPEYIKDLPENLLQGTKESFRGWNLAILGVGGGAAIGLSQSDADNDVQDGADDSIGDFATIGDIAGHPGTMFGVAISTYIVGRANKDEKIIETGKAIFEAQLITQTLTALLKLSTGRERPDGSGDRITSSFPSGHAAGSFALASTVDALHGHEIGIPLYILAGFVGFSRLSDNKHFLSDVVFGAALGTIIGRGVATFHKQQAQKKIAILPFADGRGAGLMLTMSF